MLLSKSSQSNREEMSKMSKNKNNALGDNELEAVAGGVNKANAHYHDLHENKKFKDSWTGSNDWDYDLLEIMNEKYGEEMSGELINTYKTPKEMFQ